MSNKSKSNSFIIQGSILAFAGILVRVIGLIYRIPLNRILGKAEWDITARHLRYTMFLFCCHPRVCLLQCLK